MKNLKFGVIGCGTMGNLHCENVQVIQGMETVAYYDPDEARASEFLKKFGGTHVTGKPEQIFEDPQIDGVLIQCGERWHPSLCIAAAEAGKHIFCEKPLAVELHDSSDKGPGANSVVKAIEKSGVKFQFGVCGRLAPMVKMAKRMLPDPVSSYCQCADTISAQACHNLDLAMHLFHQAAVKTIYAQGGRHWGFDPHFPVDSFTAILTFEDGTTHTSIQHGSCFNAELSKYHFQLFGRDRMVYLARRFKECHLMYNHERGKIARSWRFDGRDDDRGAYGYMGHYDELVELRDAIRHDTMPSMTVRHAREVLAVEKAILESASTSRPIDYARFRQDNQLD